ncbi:sulfur carrier protein ThiS [Deferribacter autotrophicus]|uniref:Sulfur carrier protein ThiS n=1 Tax=Deferribacter autotrophicus TaxID=500465 RepID=A0A5A8F8K7_9BACT|nr:sulfur carrier protein ThiS [Deferribacter autotrophicus]KAA0258931.1 sulfur carrier protein ThiS [Deferribacter autotrophicus]
MKVKINGVTKEVCDNITILDLINSLNLKSDRIVVEYNKTILNKDDYDKITIKEGDNLELIHFVGGG